MNATSSELTTPTSLNGSKNGRAPSGKVIPDLPIKIPANKVHETLSRHMLADGFDLIVDLKNSQGSWIRDARNGKKFLDFFTFFGSSPIGLNHPKMFEPHFMEDLMRAAVNKPSSSDAYTVEMAEFVETFAQL